MSLNRHGYKRKTSRQSWTPENMAKAIAAIKDKTHTYSQCLQLFGIPRSTLERRVKDRNKIAVGVKKMMGNMTSVLARGDRRFSCRVYFEDGGDAHGLRNRRCKEIGSRTCGAE